MTTLTIQEALKHYFGYESFRPMQEDIIQSITHGQDTLVLMPTGGGKSLCYQIPALVMPGICVVVSPLIALMRDQVEALKANGVAAAYLNSTLPYNEYIEILERVKYADLKLLYISPEKILTPQVREMLSQVKISLIAVDEAHCISTWGHDFRPEYAQLHTLRNQIEKAPIIALTATADKNTRRDIAEKLKLRDPQIFISSFDRPNLSLTVLPGQEKMRKIESFIRLRPRQAGIVYCLSRKGTESLANKLQESGYSAAFYHAGMTNEARMRVQDAFINDEVEIVCATIAFGMGIDKSNVRWVIHYNLPKNMESYYQEIGRAGRDGLPSDTLLLYSYADVVQHKRFIEESGQPDVLTAKLDLMDEYANAQICRRRILLNYFGEQIGEGGCGNCDVCKNPPTKFDGTVIAQKALSAIYRMKEEVGLNTLIDVLRGSRKKEVLERGFDKIKTYGAGSDMSTPEWQHCLMQMLHLGLIELSYDQHKTLKLTSASGQVLKGEQKVEMVRRAPIQPKIEKTRSRKSIRPADTWEEKLFEYLRELRWKIAQKSGVPPYVVFSDYTLTDMVKRVPLNEEEMRQVSGVGARKWERYGTVFLARIRKFISEEGHKV